jgi:hypothetical protein
MDHLSDILHEGRKVADDWNVIDWRPGDLSKLDTQVCISYETGTSTANALYTPSIVAQTNAGSATLAVPKLRIENLSGQTGGNTRRLFPLTGSTCKNGEMRALVLNRLRGGTADQVGMGFRLQDDVANGSRPWMFAFWHDGIFGIESMWNIDYWRRNADGSLFQGTSVSSGAGVYDMPGLQIWRNVNFGSKVGTSITLNCGANHGIITGDSLSVQTEEVDENIVTVTGSDQVRGTVTLTSGTSATNPIYNVGTGRVMSRTVMPYWVAGRIIDDVFQGKCWRMTDAEPDWDSNDNAVRMINPTVGAGAGPQTAGKLCLVANHLTDATHFVDYLSILWRSLD